jgi:hypothetical protein
VDVAVGGSAGDEPLPDLLEGGRRRGIEAEMVEVTSREGFADAAGVLVVLDLDQHEGRSLAEPDGDRSAGAGLGRHVDGVTAEDVAVERLEPIQVRGQHGEVVEAANGGGGGVWHGGSVVVAACESSALRLRPLVR